MRIMAVVAAVGFTDTQLTQLVPTEGLAQGRKVWLYCASSTLEEAILKRAPFELHDI